MILKNFAKGITGLAIAAGLTLASPEIGNQYTTSVAYAKSGRVEKQEACTPAYLKGFSQPSNPLERMIEKDRAYRSLLHKYPSQPRTNIINGSMEVERDIQGVKVKMIFPNYVKTDTGRINHYHAAGIDSYSQQEFNCMVEDNVAYITKSAELAMRDYVNTLDMVIATQEKELKKAGKLKNGERLKDNLDKDVPGYPGLKVRDVLFTPETNVKDFVPTRYYFGEIAALGVTYINTGIVGIDPKARILDHINGWPTILVHEMTHRNPKLQSYPLLSKFDPEIWASFPMLVNDDMGHFLGHHYLKDLHKISRILFNFDNKLAYDDMMGLDTMMGIEFESKNKFEKAREYISKVGVISQAIRDIAFKQYIPEFYAHPLYYMALNDFLKDDNAAFKIMMYKNFEPTLLGGPEKTRDFLLEHDDVIKSVARQSMQELKNERGKTLTEKEMAKIKSELQGRLQRMSPEQKKLLINAAERLGMPKTGNIDDIIEFGIRMKNLGIVDFNIEEEEGVILK